LAAVFDHFSMRLLGYLAPSSQFGSLDTYGDCIPRSGFEQAIETVPDGWIHEDELARTVVGHALLNRDPVRGVEVVVLLEEETSGE
jgi:hypothetical protein